MAIYHDKRGGKLTGRLRIEVQLGKHRLRGSASSLADARKVEKELLAKLEAGDFTPKPKPVPVEATRCLTLSEAQKRTKGLLWAGKTTEHESQRKLTRIISILGEDLPLDSFNASAVDQVVQHLTEQGVKDSTINRYLSCISSFLTFCKRRDLKTNDVPELDWRDEDNGRIRWITYDEEDTLIDLLPYPYNEVVYIAIRTGMRAAELLDLKPENVEAKWAHLWNTKNGDSRSVPLSPDLHERLVDILPCLPTYPQLRHMWDKARIAMGLDDDPTFVFHACRHTFATRAVQAGVNIRVLQKLMGHKTIQTTLRYAHVDDSTLSEAALSALAYHDLRGGNLRGKIAA